MLIRRKIEKESDARKCPKGHTVIAPETLTLKPLEWKIW
jgi:hypothetical protein